MDVEGVRLSMPSQARTVRPQGISAALAESRAKLRDSVPPDRWDAVMEEVTRVQVEKSASLLEAMQIVLRKVAAGWIPPRRSS
ncbi:MAG: hypothetical protein JWP40_85 [Blastococcus sp.]|nr:hypothetical protein [Blastococcus sp.]